MPDKGNDMGILITYNGRTADNRVTGSLLISCTGKSGYIRYCPIADGRVTLVMGSPRDGARQGRPADLREAWDKNRPRLCPSR
jgi:hypothetical protein